MDKIAILGDTHFGMRGDSIEFHKYYEKFYTDVFFPYLLENKVNVIFQMGDLFDRRKFINFNSLYLSRSYFFDVLKENGIQMHTLIGNHDAAFKNTLEVNSSSLLLKGYDNIIIHENFETLDFNGIPIDIVPWICEENQTDIFKSIAQSKSTICFGHFEFDGFEMDRGNVHYGGLKKNEFEKYDIVVSGHFHHKSSDGHIFYVGTPGEMTWMDYNDPKGFHMFDLKTRELEFIRNPYRMFHKVNYDDKETDFQYWKKYDFESLKDTFVKVVVINKTNPFLFDNVIDNLYKVGVSDISIVEDFTDNSIENDKDIVDQAQDTMTILTQYIDNLTLNVNNDTLKKIMREVYIEALNVEKND